MADLISVIKQLKRQISEKQSEMEKKIETIKKEYEQDIAKYQNALAVLRELNDVCEDCEGSGHHRVLDQAGIDWEFVKCETCNGTGKIIK